MLDEDQAVVSLFEDGHELERSESSSDLQLHEPVMHRQDDRKVAGDVENLNRYNSYRD